MTVSEAQLAKFLDLKGREVIRIEDFFSITIAVYGICCLGYYSREKHEYYAKRFALICKGSMDVVLGDNRYEHDSVMITLTAPRKEGEND